MPYYTFALASTFREGLIPGFELLKYPSTKVMECGLFMTDYVCEFIESILIITLHLLYQL